MVALNTGRSVLMLLSRDDDGECACCEVVMVTGGGLVWLGPVLSTVRLCFPILKCIHMMKINSQMKIEVGNSIHYNYKSFFVRAMIGFTALQALFSSKRVISGIIVILRCQRIQLIFDASSVKMEK